ncbi:uncharacterized protein LOC113329719 [Papaver somniferum]|uniref:uncharacterized protein LOC113329719 n=1 Tax=Papaver somniferum TaxID=3469 RepID=UPI000E6F6EB2|nr:uncharacterized protein LOC113329719 [Papaver somniferum]
MNIFSSIGTNEKLYVEDYFMEAVKQLMVDHGMPPSSDTFVMNNIIQPSLESYFKNVSGDSRGCVRDDNTTTFLLEESEKFGHRLIDNIVDKIPKKKKAEEKENMKVMENEDKVKYLKMLMRELLDYIMLEIEANKPISVSSNLVIYT